MFSSPYFSSYNPYEQYQDPYYSRHLAQQQLQRQLAQQRALELEQQRQREAAAYAQRLRRAQYLPDDDEYSDGEGYGVYSPWERAYAEKLRREALERKRLEAMRLELARRQAEQERIEAEARERYLETQQRLARKRSGSPASSSPQPLRRSPLGSERVPSPPVAPQPQPTPSTTLPTPSPEQLEEAATKIQTTFRVYRALRNIADLERQFQDLTSSFSLPSNIDYQTPEGIVTVTASTASASAGSILADTPKLAFTPTNYTLHAYTEALSRLLIKLDGIESWGDASVRKSRRGVVSRVEAEASRVEAYWKQAWTVHLQGPTEPSSATLATEVAEAVDTAAPEDQKMATAEEGPAPETTTEDVQMAELPALETIEVSEVSEVVGGSPSFKDSADEEVPLVINHSLKQEEVLEQEMSAAEDEANGRAMEENARTTDSLALAPAEDVDDLVPITEESIATSMNPPAEQQMEPITEVIDPLAPGSIPETMIALPPEEDDEKEIGEVVEDLMSSNQQEERTSSAEALEESRTPPSLLHSSALPLPSKSDIWIEDAADSKP